MKNHLRVGDDDKYRKTVGKRAKESLPSIAQRPIKTAIIKLLIVAAAVVVSPMLLSNGLTAQAQPSQGLAGTTFPPPIFDTIRSQAAYVVNIPFSSEGKPVFEPKEISTPTKMTVIWFNNDGGQHSVTTLRNNTEDKRNSLRAALSALHNQINTAKNSLKIYQSALDDKIRNMSEAHKKLAQLENIKNNNKDYQEIERIAEQKANGILNNRKAVVLAAVIAVLEALRNRPDKQQLLIYDSFYPSNNNNSTADIFAKMMSSSPTANPEKNYLLAIPFHHKEIMKMAEDLYDNLLKAAVNNTMYHLAPTATTQTVSLNNNKCEK